MSCEKIKTSTLEDGSILHYGVAAIIYCPQRRRFLLVERNIPPLYVSIITGHVNENEDDESALIREVLEESGLDVKESKFISREKIKRRCKHADEEVQHSYALYLVSRFEGQVNIKQPNEVRHVEWYGIEDIPEIENLDPLVKDLYGKRFFNFR